ncbi:MAG: C-type lectin domain-containing protein [Deltaproteobacteria bacterium]|nr:C-type lectin domain-containing protein [Deltaproteobacteria bacterium]
MARFSVAWVWGASMIVGVGCGSDSSSSGDVATATDSTMTQGDGTVTGDTGLGDTSVSTGTDDSSVATGTDDTSGVEDTAATVADATEDAPDEVLDGAADTSAEVASDAFDGDATPECTLDEHCVAGQMIAPPNACVVPRCMDGVCTMGPPVCDDGDPCTLDACDPRMGCVAFEQTYDIGSSRLWYCPGPIAGDQAGAICAERGAELATVTSLDVAQAWAGVLLDQGASDAWVSASSGSFCQEPRRVIFVPCNLFDSDACTVTTSCLEEHAFFCEIACNDGDPCTRDLVGADGLCTTEPETCDDNDACTTDSCDERDGCLHSRPKGQCDDGVPCTTDSCDPASGECQNTVIKTAWDATHDLLSCPGPLTWTAARARCSVEGAVLAMPTSDAHEALLAGISASQGATGALWAPLKQQDGGNQPWDWTDGGGSGAPPWCASVQPNFSEAGYCAAWSTAEECLLDVPCTEVRSFGCVIDTTVP